jgi:GT2 family glycosyltransferase
MSIPQLSIIIVSFRTRDTLRECLRSLEERSREIQTQVIVVDNASDDGSAEMVTREFPRVLLIPSEINVGFAGANNLAFPHATARYVVLLNSDAFLNERAIQRAIAHMDREETVGAAGGRLVGRDGSWQPSARQFPSLLNDFFSLSGLAARFPHSKLFGRADRTWADPHVPADVDWVPGAFAIIRRAALEQVGYFDERFFLYYEEVDLCKRLRDAGFTVRYWPDVVITHWGGESSKTLRSLAFSRSGCQLTLWRMRSAFLYYRKHKGSYAWLVKEMEHAWEWARALKNTLGSARSAAKREDSTTMQRLVEQAWKETCGGRVSPARPW